MHSKYFRLFSFLVIICSCRDLNHQYEKQFLENYSESKRIFKYELTDHFPSELKMGKMLFVSYPVAANDIGMANFILSQQVDSAEFKNVVQKLERNDYVGRNPKDSTFIILGDTLDYSEKINGIPIPSFISYESDFGINDKYLSKNHRIYVLESKPGKFMDAKYLTSNDKLPKEWKNGYSRGIATNIKGQELIYWLCVW